MKRALAMMTALAVAGCGGGGSGFVRVGSPAPAFTAPTSTGTKLSLASYSGKAVYLNFFATWCPPCNEEAPAINALQKKYASAGLQVIGVDELEDGAKAQSFVRKYALVYPAVLDDGTLEGKFLINALPDHVFIGRDGVVKKIVQGEMKKAQIERAIRAILST